MGEPGTRTGESVCNGERVLFGGRREFWRWTAVTGAQQWMCSVPQSCALEMVKTVLFTLFEFDHHENNKNDWFVISQSLLGWSSGRAHWVVLGGSEWSGLRCLTTSLSP